MANAKVDFAGKEDYHSNVIPHIERVDNKHNPDARRFIVQFIALLYQEYAPGAVQTDAQDNGYLNEEYRSAELRYCVGGCKNLKEREPSSAHLVVWDSLGDHAGKELRRRFTVSLTSDIVGDEKGNVRVIKPEWVKPYNRVKKWAREMLWEQLGMWGHCYADDSEFDTMVEDNQGKPRHRWDMKLELMAYKEQEGDGQFRIHDGVRDWSKGPGLRGIPRDATGKPMLMRPSMWRKD